MTKSPVLRLAEILVLSALVAWGAPVRVWAAESPIAKITTLSGLAEVRAERTGDRWAPVKDGDLLYLKDMFRTGPQALARLEFQDSDDTSGAEATVVDVIADTEISLEQFSITQNVPKRRTGLLDVIKGTLRALTRGWKSGSIFSVKAGTTVCGIRGSEVVLSYDPKTGAYFTSLHGEMFTFFASDNQAAISKMLEIARTLAAGKDLPDGVTKLSPGEQRQVDKDGKLVTIKVPPETLRELGSLLGGAGGGPGGPGGPPFGGFRGFGGPYHPFGPFGPPRPGHDPFDDHDPRLLNDLFLEQIGSFNDPASDF